MLYYKINPNISIYILGDMMGDMRWKIMELKYLKKGEKKPDLWIRMLQLFIIVSWVTAISALVIIGVASPQIEIFFDRKLGCQFTYNMEYRFSLIA